MSRATASPLALLRAARRDRAFQGLLKAIEDGAPAGVGPFSLGWVGDVLVLTFEGALCVSTITAMHRVVASELAQTPARAVVIDASSGVGTMSSGDWARAGEECAAIRFVQCVALVPPPAQTEAARAYGPPSWPHGLMRLELNKLEHALDWAAHRRAPKCLLALQRATTKLPRAAVWPILPALSGPPNHPKGIS
jgi:hypothetical protein